MRDPRGKAEREENRCCFQVSVCSEYHEKYVAT